MSNDVWYLEYEIQKNRPGVLGGISSLIGILSINILTINGIAHNRRGMLMKVDDPQKVEMLAKLLNQMDSINVTALRPPKVTDRLAIRHGQFIQSDDDNQKIFRFTRNEIGLLVDFMGELFKKKGHQLIGIRGKPRVGKTESVVASSVYANKRWMVISSTLLKQTIRTRLHHQELSENQVYIIDGMVSTRASDEHRFVLQEVFSLQATKVVEHPDVLMRTMDLSLKDFDYIIELRDDPNEEVIYEHTLSFEESE